MRIWAVILFVVAGLAACSDEPAGEGNTPDATSEGTGGTGGGAGGDAGGAGGAGGEDTGGEDGEPTDEGSDEGAETDTGPACENSCLDENGKNKKSLCPQPVSDWDCIAGCCVPVFKCATDEDCAVQGFEEEQCTDERFACRCDVASAECFTWFCGTDGDCAEGEHCSAGVCEAAPSTDGSYEVRIVSPATALTPGAATTVLAEGFDPGDQDATFGLDDLVFSSSDESVVNVTAAGVATGGDTPGDATITATSGGKSATVTIRNVVPEEGATATVICVEQGGLVPVEGRYALVSPLDGAVVEKGDIPVDGVISTDIEFPADGLDLHIIGPKTDWVSWLGFGGGEVFMPISIATFGAIAIDQQNQIREEDTELLRANVVRGEVSFEEYLTGGEFDVTVNSFGLSNALFDFSLPAILGPNVKRYFHPEANVPGLNVAEEAEIPGGITFALAGPVLPDFYLAAPEGQHTLWTMGGRIEASAVAPYIADIVDAATSGDNLDFPKLLSALFPLFNGFASGITPDLDFAGDGSNAITEVSPGLRVPMGLRWPVLVPTMPDMAEYGYPDAAVIISGATKADGVFIPLGLTGGADTGNEDTNPPDGVVDSDESTPEQDPVTVNIAPLHTGLSGPHTRYTVAMVALSVNPGGDKARPDGGSAILVHSAPSEWLPSSDDTPDFLPFPMGSQWDPETRTATVQAVAGADTQRLLFKGKTGRHWTVWLSGADSYAVPLMADVFEEPELEDRTVNPEYVMVSSFDFAEGHDAGTVAAPGGKTLDLLLHTVTRASFIDIRQ